jgi:L-iditol 2-dehydrogenase
MRVGEIYVVGRSPRRAAHALRLGARSVFTDGIPAAMPAIRAATGGRGADVVIECTGQLEVWEAAPQLARRGGTVVLFGGCPPGTQVRLDTQRLHYDQLRLVSPFHFTQRAVRRAYEMITSPEFSGTALISATYRLDELPAALAAHQRGDGIKFAIRP